LHQLYAGTSDFTVERVAPDALEMRVLSGWGSKPFERLFCDASDLPRASTQREVNDMRVSVLETDRQGLPIRVRFAFPSTLESPERLWFVWQGIGPVRWQPPAMGQRVTLPALSLVELLATYASAVFMDTVCRFAYLTEAAKIYAA
jgi:hypothetical protein